MNGAAARIDVIDPSTGSRLSVVRTPGAAWDQLQLDLTSGGVELPVESHSGLPIAGRERRVLFGISDANGRLRWGGVADVGRSRIVPWRSVVRVHRVGRGMSADVDDTAAAVLSLVAQTEKALRIHVELSDPDTSARARISELLLARGYQAVTAPRQYVRTILINLRQTEAALMASFHATGRRHIRGFSKYPLRCELLTDQRWAGRLRALDAETMLRTNGSLDSLSWPDMLRFVTEHPTHAALLGVVRIDASDENALVGYVLGVRHGDTVEYRRAASTRIESLRAPLLYAPTWQLMRWAQEVGAGWFDFGGVGDGSHASGEATGGISDFKRYFSDVTTEVGAELTYSPAVYLDTLARAIASGAGAMTRALRRR